MKLGRVVYLSATTAVSVSIGRILVDGSFLVSETVQQALYISATTGLSGVNTLHAVVVES